MNAADNSNPGGAEGVGGEANAGATDRPEGWADESRPAMPVPEGGWPADEYTGKGGDYIRHPYTGVRYPAENYPGHGADPLPAKVPTADGDA